MKKIKLIIGLTFISLFCFGQIQKDKVLHGTVGMIAGGGGSMACYISGCNAVESLAITTVFTASLGATKEWIIDAKQGGTVEFADFAATVVGGWVGWAVMTLPLSRQIKRHGFNYGYTGVGDIETQRMQIIANTNRWEQERIY